MKRLPENLNIRNFRLLLAGLLLAAACGNDSVTNAPGDRVTDPFPLALGDTWQYTIEQSIFVHEDTTQPPITASSTGRQSVTVNRTEEITGDEAFGVTTRHVLDYLFSVGADTVVETRYLAPHGDRVLLKAEEMVYNPTFGFIPLSNKERPSRYGTMLKVGGVKMFITLERLGYLLLGPRGPLQTQEPPALTSDGIQNDPNVLFYDKDYIFVYDELYKGKSWVSLAAQDVGGVDISQKVSNIIPSLGDYTGPIAEVEETNTLIEAAASENFIKRYYYKGGVGLIQAEISDPGFIIWLQLPDGSIQLLGQGTWTIIKKLVSYDVK